MISNASPVTPAIPIQRSILGIATSSDSSPSFADQLANEVSHAGGDPTKITPAPRQNSDTPQLNFGSSAAGGPGATGPEPFQYSFFQYLVGTPQAIDAPSADHTPLVSSASVGGTQPEVQDAGSADPGWLSPPYYAPPAPVFVSWENPPGVINRTASPETDLQNLATQLINDSRQFVWGGVEAKTPQQLIDNVVSYAQGQAAA